MNEIDFLNKLNSDYIERRIQEETEKYNELIDYIKSRHNYYKSIEEYFSSNLGELNNFKNYSYRVILYLIDKNYDEVRFFDNIKNESIPKEDFLNTLKDKDFTLELIEDSSYYYELFIPEYNLTVLWIFDD